jgi:hypothetical protein
MIFTTHNLSENSRKSLLLLALILSLPFAVAAQNDDEDEDYISPVRPTVSDSAKIQKKGVLQIEAGGDFDFDAPDFRNRQSAPLGVYFAVNKKLRLDFEIDAVVSQKDSMTGRRETEIGDVHLGFKAIARDKPEVRLAAAFAYSIKLPAANEETDLGTGRVDHNLRLIFHRTYGKNDYIFNAAYLNNGRADESGRDSGAQTVFTVERELTKKFDIAGEIYGNTIEENQPRGIYLLGALIYKVNKRLHLDIGVRPGFGRDAPKIGVFTGLTVGVANLYKRK